MQYQIIDVFADKLFSGNPAGVCLLEAWLPNALLHNIAAENNLPETAFLVKQEGHYALRWFSPLMEVELCGHATLASAFVLFEEAEKGASEIQFKTLSGMLSVTKEDGLLCLELPARPVAACPSYSSFEKALGLKPLATYRAVDFLLLLESEEALKNLRPDFAALKEVKAEAKVDTDCFGVIATAKGREVDFVSRFFAPNVGIDEDAVTGRAHCSLIPFWSEKLGKPRLTARQLSKRGGELFCENLGERVKIAGKAVRYLRGKIEVAP
ncbi:MAG: PhzF family phenazine biosynthesis protein [Cystobacterineae bacterium]|nr:PhzF family phenazine biosynthesis protein [Cystobacterineae bacterium]